MITWMNGSLGRYEHLYDFSSPVVTRTNIQFFDEGEGRQKDQNLTFMWLGDQPAARPLSSNLHFKYNLEQAALSVSTSDFAGASLDMEYNGSHSFMHRSQRAQQLPVTYSSLFKGLIYQQIFGVYEKLTFSKVLGDYDSPAQVNIRFGGHNVFTNRLDHFQSFRRASSFFCTSYNPYDNCLTEANSYASRYSIVQRGSYNSIPSDQLEKDMKDTIHEYKKFKKYYERYAATESNAGNISATNFKSIWQPVLEEAELDGIFFWGGGWGSLPRKVATTQSFGIQEIEGDGVDIADEEEEGLISYNFTKTAVPGESFHRQHDLNKRLYSGNVGALKETVVFINAIQDHLSKPLYAGVEEYQGFNYE